MNFKSLFHHFSNETTFHGFKRLWIGSWLRWPFWTLILLLGFGMSIYQIYSKFMVLIANPMSININMKYQEKMVFPGVTICPKLKVKVSYVVQNIVLLNMLDLIFPQDSGNFEFTDSMNRSLREMQSLTPKNFFAAAGPKVEDVILSCTLPNGQTCSSQDFEPHITDEGYCFMLKESSRVNITEAGRGNGMKILLNLGQYERVNETDAMMGTTLIIHDGNEPLPYNGYDLMAGYHVAIVLRRTTNIQLGDCESGNTLRYFSKYTYPACQVENLLLASAFKCDCKPFTLPSVKNEPIEKNSTVDEYLRTMPDCTLEQHLTCVDRKWTNRSASSPMAIQPRSFPFKPSNCTGECRREEFEQEVYYSLFKDVSTLRKMISKDKYNELLQAYQQGRDGAAYLNFYLHVDADYGAVNVSANGYAKLIVEKKLVPPYGSLYDVMPERVTCLGEILEAYSVKNDSDFRFLNASVIGEINGTMGILEASVDNLEIDETLRFANSLKERHMETCSKENREVCSLAAFYDMLTIRSQLEEKNKEIKLLRNGPLKSLSKYINAFASDNETLTYIYKKSRNEDIKYLSRFLDRYVQQVLFCLNETGRTYDRILINGQPSMKSAELYDRFLKDLNYVNVTIHESCKGAGLDKDEASDLPYNFTNRRDLSSKVFQLLSNSEASTRLTYKFNNVLAKLVQKYEGKDFERHSLNVALDKMANMSDLLGKYLQQNTTDHFKKSQFYSSLLEAYTRFQQGLTEYKKIVEERLNDLERLFQTAVAELQETYPGEQSDLLKIQTLLSDINVEENEDANKSANFDFTTLENIPNKHILQILCLRRAARETTKIQSYMDPVGLDTYKINVSNLLSNLKVYVDDIHSAKKFFNDNFGLVKVYFRDMSLKESTQERAYDFLSFLCDMGGIIGLWIGGSMVSIVECIDLLIFENIRSCFCCKRKEKSCQLNEVQRDKDKASFSPVLQTSNSLKQRNKNDQKDVLETLLPYTRDG